MKKMRILGASLACVCMVSAVFAQVKVGMVKFTDPKNKYSISYVKGYVQKKNQYRYRACFSR